ncbi:molybdopterin synthase catalytic subunit MoaE [Azospira inquinata]|uniref:Molybdopterin synthase catalytic subunit n=1 Tax=Azospira inquinata TaxID=2785627 RepID=A0A975XTW9_9RHOO|nr:molybdopterin synthase catalytic subunit MoaE [Azospira inquinata]QWT46493.1 molybdopterin synthase catalytic subunit MoaE [Azospira inquinata]QWT48183.1 molybdopterin synthase catalytic subunit MoaE [Azospira inquinata]
MTISVQTEDFDLGQEVTDLRGDDPGIGAVASFVGLVRDMNQGQTDIGEMFLEHYPGMTEKALADIEVQARARWDLRGVRVVHRVGRLAPKDQIVLVAVAAVHRGDAFQACEFIMDYLKTQAPFWKREQTRDGARWVEAKADDEAAAQRWAGAD